MGKIILGIVLFMLSQWLAYGPLHTPLALIAVALVVWGLYQVFANRGKVPVWTEAKGAAHSFVSGKTAIAIYPDKRTLVLKEGRQQKEYPFTDLRSWETNLQTGGNAIGTGTAVAGHNIGNAIANKKASGLFVTVRDIDHPVWRIEMLKKADQQRWMEIFRQLVNEG